MNILSTQYTLSNKALEIYVAGCNGQPHCSNCHNPTSWDFNLGMDWREFIDEINDKCSNFLGLIENIMIFGGEPLDQYHDELEQMLVELDKIELPIWLFTRYSINEIPNFIKEYCTYIKCGRYEESLTTDTNIQYGIKLATSNQYIYKKGIDY